jgi:acyl-CoA hydrolase
MKTQTLFILILFCSITNIIYGQEDRKYEFDGKVIISHKLINEVEVTIYDEDIEIERFTTAFNGKFVFLAIPEKHYTIQFEQEGYETKRIVINTDNTREIKDKVAPYRFKVILDEKLPAEQSSKASALAGVIEINADKTKFIHNTRIVRSKRQRESYDYLSNN